MEDHRYSLESYHSGGQSRYECPSCGKARKFTRYVDNQTGEYIAEEVGKCDRASNCGYHYPPREYFAQHGHPDKKEKTVYSSTTRVRQVRTVAPRPPKPAAYIPVSVLKNSRKAYDQNQFILCLRNHFDGATVSKLISRYQIGTSKHWPGASIFWYIDLAGHVTGGQVVLFGTDGHTVKYRRKDGTPDRRNRPIHSVIKYQCDKQGKPLPAWLTEYIEYQDYLSTLFGLHLLLTEPLDKPIALVEAPATAIVASAYFPDYIWMAVGSLDWLNEKRLLPLKGRKVFLYPDLNGFDKWQAKVQKLSHIADFTVSNLLERLATEEERKAGLDLRDYLLQLPLTDFISPFAHQPDRLVESVYEEENKTFQRLVPDEVLNIDTEDDYPVEWDAPAYLPAASSKFFVEPFPIAPLAFDATEQARRIKWCVIPIGEEEIPETTTIPYQDISYNSVQATSLFRDPNFHEWQLENRSFRGMGLASLPAKNVT